MIKSAYFSDCYSATRFYIGTSLMPISQAYIIGVSLKPSPTAAMLNPDFYLANMHIWAFYAGVKRPKIMALALKAS
jgi:hypothetical protein